MHCAMRDWLPSGAVVKNSSANAGGTRDVGLIPGWGRSHGEGNGSPLQHPCLENPQEEPRGAAVCGIAKSHTTGHTSTRGRQCQKVVGLNMVAVGHWEDDF